MMLKIGDKVVISTDVFPGATDPDDIKLRGAKGVIAWDLQDGTFQVDFQDGDFGYFSTDEMRKL